ncbi:MBL fold metallo-hydrolase [Rhodococcus sp. T2V]|uniref:MBL fold metallo-hydrolase n=1 Tax=Rhodococcus sp. T2V TaxID=3034164 RepID=UPI0023E1CC06|nr:MBL fold metallo-hydrolase [Rhodococcus sp. T2V]MDF3308116.1 MBL fold metallo-hydrolase [Rhodococcus sp. T2V]
MTENAGVLIRWRGHATVEITDSGTTILTDPVLTARVAHLRRRRGPDPMADPVRPDAVLLSHLHADHTHLPSLALIENDVPIVVPRGAVDAFTGLRVFGDRLIEMSPGQDVRLGSVTVRAVPAVHDGRRWRRGPQRAQALGYVVDGAASTYFAGDTALDPAMAEWVPRCDVALLPVGGWGPNLGPGHMDPESAAAAARSVAAAVSIPIHFGTLWPIGLDAVRPRRFHGPGGEFVRRADADGLRAVELDPGEAFR